MPASGQTTPPRTSRLVQLLPWLVLLTGMALSLWTWDALRQGAIKEAQIRFQFRAQQVETSLRERLHSNRLALQGGAALFAASDQVSRAEWRTYVSALGLADNYPGLQSMAMSCASRVPSAPMSSGSCAPRACRASTCRRPAHATNTPPSSTWSRQAA